MKAKHNEEIVEIVEIVVSDIIVEQTEREIQEIQDFKCEICEFVSSEKLTFNDHMAEKHTLLDDKETNEIRLEVVIRVGCMYKE